MKKSTGIVFVLAVVLAAVAYFYDWKRQPFVEKSPNAVETPFSVESQDIIQITITRAGMTIVFDRKNDGWYISRPIAERADQAALNNVARYISIVPQDTKVPATPELMETYGLINPAQILEFKLQNGETHRLRMGASDFSGLEVYAQVDDSKDVVLISNVLFRSADKSLDEFRDRTGELPGNR